MRNLYVIEDDTAYIVVKAKEKHYVVVLDVDHMELLESKDLKIYIANASGKPYPSAYVDGKITSLSRVLYDINEDQQLKYKNSNALDLRSSNVEMQELFKNIWTKEGDTLYLTLVKGSKLSQYKFSLQDEETLKQFGRIVELKEGKLQAQKDNKRINVKRYLFGVNGRYVKHIDGDIKNLKRENVK